MKILDIILGVLKVAAPLVPVPGAALVPEVIDAIPDIEAAVKSALTKEGLTNEQIDAIFAEVLPPDQLGIDSNHPFKDEPPATAAPVAPTQQQVSQSQPFVHATHVPLDPSLKPAISSEPSGPPPPNPFERAR